MDTQEKNDLTPRPVADLLLHVGDIKHLVLKAWILCLESASRVHSAVENDGGDKRFVQLELACNADGVASPDPV